MSEVNNPAIRRFVPIDTAQFNAAAGAAGWVDTDVSATTGLSTSRIWAVVAKELAGNWATAGVRAHGVAAEPIVISHNPTFFTHVDNSGHVDLYRHAGDVEQYYFLGYFE